MIIHRCLSDLANTQTHTEYCKDTENNGVL